MFENIIEINIDNINDLPGDPKAKFSWQDRDSLVCLITECIKSKKLHQSIFLNKLSYKIVWKDKESFDDFCKDKRYIEFIKKINDINIYISWI